MTDVLDAVLFDIDGTLCEYRRSGEELLSLSFDAVRVEPFFGIEDYYDRFGDAARHHDTIDDIREQCFAELADTSGRDPAVGRQIADAYASERDHRDVEFVDGAREAVEDLSSEYRVGVVTNGGRWMQSEKLAGLGIEDAFETVVYAGQDCPAKPRPDPFAEALDALGVSADRAVHVGNSLRADVQGAHAAGVHSAWLRDDDELGENDPEPSFTLESMHELRERPWR